MTGGNNESEDEIDDCSLVEHPSIPDSNVKALPAVKETADLERVKSYAHIVTTWVVTLNL